VHKNYSFKGEHGKAIGAAFMFIWIVAVAAHQYVTMDGVELRKEWFTEYTVTITIRFNNSNNPHKLHELFEKNAIDTAQEMGVRYYAG
jgi:hypothetical protein